MCLTSSIALELHVYWCGELEETLLDPRGCLTIDGLSRTRTTESSDLGEGQACCSLDRHFVPGPGPTRESFE